MLTRKYGRTDMDFSLVSFGGMRFDNPEDIDANADIVMHAYNKGITYYDTAPGYCHQLSEVIIGKAVAQMGREKVYVGTKCSVADGDEMRASIEQSLERMGLDYFDVFYVWWVTSEEVWRQRVDGGAVAAAMKAKEEGLIRNVAISSHLPGDQLTGVINEVDFDGVLLGYCALNFPYRESAVAAAGAKQMGVLTMNPLGGGLIPQNAERLDFIRDADDPSVVSAALRFNLSNPNITSALVGFTTKDHIDQACAAVENFKPHSDEHLTATREQILESFDGMCTGCGYCLPCPKGVEIPQFMDAYNLKILGANDTAIAGRLQYHWTISPDNAKECTQCGECQTKCTQHIPICERLDEVIDIAERVGDVQL
ncbi:MAG: aldo/keto reductase [Planctomycetota bacterium]|jgi:predicted aldo/keto reductase-like oxidoreductase